ncbi:hypothetical protein K4F52_003200 [Lecanicillium sp. MT-2017a]|nr:hypothetical protein K4F52_003200 [Lecanicillium sp. MT-2017a]
MTAAVLASPPHNFGWVIPENLKAAVYEWSFVPGRNGDEVALTHFEMDPKVNFTAKRLRSRLPMPYGHVRCNPYNEYNNASFSEAHEQTAMYMLANWCERYRPRLGGVASAVQEGMSWYRCAFDLIYSAGPHRTCARDEIFKVNEILDRECGTGLPGEIKIDDWKMAYGRGIHGNNICKNILDQPGQ